MEIGKELGSADYDKVYVDEIQDCRQAETTLFLIAAGMNVQSLFLAGDPVQVFVSCMLATCVFITEMLLS